MAETIIPTHVRAFAAEHSVPLSRITPQSADGIVSMLDLYDWAKTKGDTSLMLEALTAQFAENAGHSSASRGPAQRPSRPGGTVSSYEVQRAPVNAMARNPLVDQTRLAARMTRKSAPSTPPPTLFAAGDTPAFTVSGIPPTALLDVPWAARHSMATAPTAAAAYAIAVECTGQDAAQTAEMLYGHHSGNTDYRDRVEAWRTSSLTDMQLEVEPGATARAEREHRAQMLAPSSPDADAREQAVVDALLGGQYAGNGRVPGQPSDPARYR